jgi:hypothetical protein
VVDLLVLQRLPAAVCQIFRDQQVLKKYFDQAEEFMQEARARGETFRYLDGLTVLRMQLLGIAFAALRVGSFEHAAQTAVHLLT